MLDSSYQGVKRLFVLANDNTTGEDQVSVDSFKKYFLPRVKIEDYYKVEKYQQDKVMIIQLVIYCILLILKKITD